MRYLPYPPRRELRLRVAARYSLTDTADRCLEDLRSDLRNRYPWRGAKRATHELGYPLLDLVTVLHINTVLHWSSEVRFEGELHRQKSCS